MLSQPNYHIIDTDYENYSLVYNCVDRYYGFYRTEYMYILARTEKIDDALKDELVSKIKDTVKQYDFDYNFVYTTQGKMCSYEHLRV
jgi:lipocalin